MFSQLIICGRVGNDPTLETSEKGTDWMSINVAVNYFERGETNTYWIKCTAFGRTAQGLEKSGFGKGSLVLVSGQLKVKDFDGKTFLNMDANQVRVLLKKEQSDTTTTSNEETMEEIPF